MAMQKKTVLNRLAKVLNTLAGEHYGNPAVLDKAQGFNSPTLCWNGPFDWIQFSSGQSYLCGEVGNYSLPIEPELQEVINLAKSNGYYFEPYNQSQMCLAD